MKNLEQHEKMHREVETLGNAGNYHGQAQAFLAGTGALIEGRFIGMESGHFGPGDTENRDVWEIRISRNGRAYTFKYGKSIKDTEDRLDSIMGASRDRMGSAVRRNPDLIKGSMSGARIKKREEVARAWVTLETIEAMSAWAPKAYDILSSVEKYEPTKDIDEFASEFGIEKPSEAVRIHKAVMEQYQEMRALFDNDELETMGLIA